MAILGQRTTGQASARISSRQCQPLHGIPQNVSARAATVRQPASVVSRMASLTQQHSYLHSRVIQLAAPKRCIQTFAAAQETMVLDDPVVEFLGVNNGMQTVRGVIHSAADPSLVYSILTDYDNCARVFRNIVSSQTILGDDGTKQVQQACQWQVIGLKGSFNVNMNVAEDPAARRLVFTLNESSFMRDFEGRWQIEAAPGGGCYIEHILAVKPVMEIPPPIAPYTSSIFKQQVLKLLQDLEGAIRRELAAAASAN